MVLNIDIGATILDMIGVKAPTDVQGESYLPLLEGKNVTNWRTSLYYHYYDYPGVNSVRKHYGVRTETHKLIHFYGDDIDDWEMFDLVKDPEEVQNLYHKEGYDDIKKDLLAELKRL